jgi:DNA-directed RNA polymerase specialized sigma24 family protein
MTPQNEVPTFWSYLPPEPDRAVGEFNRIRERLVFYFTHHGFSDPENLAGEVILRVHKRCREGVPMESGIMNYCYGVARFVKIEKWKLPVEHQPAADTEHMDSAPPNVERRILLEQLLRHLTSPERDVIIRFYLDDNQDMEDTLGVTRNALRIKAHRIMEKLRKLARTLPKK